MVLVIRSSDVDEEEMPETLCFTVRDWICGKFGCLSRMIHYGQLEEYLCWAFIEESKTFAQAHCQPDVYGIKWDCYYSDKTKAAED